MILADSEILKHIADKTIVIDPFDPTCLGSNSYDVHLSEHLGIYNRALELDAKKHNELERFCIPKEGYLLQPGTLYLGSIVEYTETHKHVPFLDGKSSTGRLGISIHATAGKGDVGFCNHWTLEIFVIEPVRVYAGMPIGQLIYHEVKGDVLVPYNKKKSAKYNERNPKPVESKMYKNKF
jgi:dCTP deaminase